MENVLREEYIRAEAIKAAAAAYPGVLSISDLLKTADMIVNYIKGVNRD